MHLMADEIPREPQNRFLSIFDPSYDSSSSNTERRNLLGDVIRASTEQPLGAGVGRMSDFLGERVHYASGNTGNAENAVFTILGQYGLLPALFVPRSFSIR